MFNSAVVCHLGFSKFKIFGSQLGREGGAGVGNKLNLENRPITSRQGDPDFSDDFLGSLKSDKRHHVYMTSWLYSTKW